MLPYPFICRLEFTTLGYKVAKATLLKSGYKQVAFSM